MDRLLQGCRGGEVQSFRSFNKPVFMWSVEDVCDWMRKGCLEEGTFLLEAVSDHAISGRVLLRLTDRTLKRMGLHEKSQRHEVLQAVKELRLQQELEDLIDIADDDITTKAREFEQVHDIDSSAVFALDLKHFNKEITAAEGIPKEGKSHAYVQTTDPIQSPSLLERPFLLAHQQQVAITEDSFSSINSNLRAVRGSLAGMRKDVSNMTKAIYCLAKSINKLAKRNITLNSELVGTNQAINETMQRLAGVLNTLGALVPMTDLRTKGSGIMQKSTGTLQTSEALHGNALNAQRRQRLAVRRLKHVKSKEK